MKGKASTPRRQAKAASPTPAQLPSAQNRIVDAEQAIRDRVCSPKLRPRLTKTHKVWNEIVSSLDAIGDTEQAVSAYLERYPPQADFGSRYLFVYGVLQALFIQQDAVIHLSAALGGSPAKVILGDQRIARARDIRNRAVGHPTRKDRPKEEPATTHQISRISLGAGGFDMLTADEHGQIQMETINVVRLIIDQSEAVAELLEGLEVKLDGEDKTARKAFQHERLEALFPDWLGYTFEKLYEATSRDASLGPASLDAIKGVLQKFAEALERRGLGIEAYPGIKAWFAQIQHPMQEIESFFDSTQSRRLHPKTAAIVVTHFKQKLEELKGMAAGIDEDWRVEEEDSA